MERLPEEIPTGNEGLADAGTCEPSQVAPTNDRKKLGGSPAAQSANPPPRKKKNEALVLKHYRLRAIDVRQTEAVVAQRGSDLNDTVRKQYERGVNMDTALGAPGSDGLYGLHQGQRLAELLRTDIDGLISFALNHGVVPTMLAEYRRIIGGLSDTIQGDRPQLPTFPHALEARSFPSSQMNKQPEESQFTAGTEMSDEADSVLGLFFGASDSATETVDTDRFPSQ